MRIAIINTGGTISCTGKPLAPMSARDFKSACQANVDPILTARVPDFTLHYVLDHVQFSDSSTHTLDSTNL